MNVHLESLHLLHWHPLVLSKRRNLGSRKQRHAIAHGLFSDAHVFPEIYAQIDPPHFKHNDFDQHPLLAPQPWELA